MDGTVVIPTVVLVTLINLAIAIVGRAKAKQANGNGNVMLKLINQVKNGQEDCHSCLNDVKTQVIFQTDVLKDIRDILRKENKHGNE